MVSVSCPAPEQARPLGRSRFDGIGSVLAEEGFEMGSGGGMKQEQERRTMKTKNRFAVHWSWAAALWLASSGQPQAAEPPKTGEDDPDRVACTAQLEKVYDAIQAYRRDHKDLPNWLSDLVPKYIPETNQLICPITKQTGRTHSFEHLKDPKMRNAYLYEFSTLPMGHVWNGGQVRMRDFKRRQMGLIGGEVPIVRCHLHKPVLNLGFDGRIYESPMNWEENFKDYVDMSAHNMENLFAEVSRPAAVRRPAPEADGPTAETLVGKAAPEFSLPLLDGGEIDLAAHQNKHVVLLDFWATWCGPCREAMPTLAEISRDYASKGVKYFAVNLREEQSKIRGYLKEAKLDIAVPLDKDGSIARKYGVRGIPTMVIVGKDGKVKKVHVGSSPSLKRELTRTLDELLAIQ
jgi:thiol-disulfide isomerase/thioredoxin